MGVPRTEGQPVTRSGRGNLALALLLAGCALFAWWPHHQTLIAATAARDSQEDTIVAAPAAPALHYLTSGDTFPKTTLVIPVQGMAASRLRDTFGDARGSARRHNAIDITAPQGTPVIAAAPATVVKRDNGPRGGIALYALAPDHRTIYYYAHLQGYADGVVEGRKLEAGDLIGYVGDTGNAGAGNYHLHFEITTTTDPRRYWGGDPINPYPLLRNGVTR